MWKVRFGLGGGAVAPTHLVPKAGRRLGTHVVVCHRKYDDTDSEGQRIPVAFSFYTPPPHINDVECLISAT